uniref:Death ligand signal enhancer n=1 Tax=Syphacia muris TaxID=451379 RepID=A0A0N5AP76_9BILA
MNAQRQVVRNVWKSWAFAKSPLIVSPIKYKKDHDDSQYSTDDNIRASWIGRYAKAENLLKTPSELLKLISHCQAYNGQIIGTNFNGSPYFAEPFYTVFEGNNGSRLDVLSILVDDAAVKATSKQLKSCKSKQQLPKADACIQTDSAATATKCTSTPSLNKVLENYSVENEVANELAELGLGIEAMDVWQNAANTGCAEAMYNIAMCYANGEYVSKDLKKAIFFWNEACKLGHALSAYQLAVCYINGHSGIMKDVVYGWKLMKKSAAGGCAEAQFSLGCRCLLNKNMKKAKKYLTEAVRKQDIFERVNSWLTMESIPDNAKIVLKEILNS